MDQTVLLKSAISEYGSALNRVDCEPRRKLDADKITEVLCREHDWTDPAARALVSLANDYGAFMLRNALALAVVLDREDGALGF